MCLNLLHYSDNVTYFNAKLSPHIINMYISYMSYGCFLKGRSRRLRSKAQILEDPLGNPYDVLKVLLWPPYGPKGPTKVPYGPLFLPKKEPSSSR